MSYFAATVTLFLLLLSIASATRYIANEEPNKVKECEGQLGYMKMDTCKEYLKPPTVYLKMVPINCCRELELVNEKCRCSALNETLQDPTTFQSDPQVMQQVIEVAQDLPNICQLGKSKPCRIGPIQRPYQGQGQQQQPQGQEQQQPGTGGYSFL